MPQFGPRWRIYHNQIETIICQSRRALEYLHPNNLAFRTFTTWKLAIAYQIQGDRAAAIRAYSEALSIAQSSGNTITTMVATVGLGGVQKTENQLHLAAETYRRVIQLAGDLPFHVPSYQANLGLAQIYYEWNDLKAAEQHGQQSAELARHIGKSDEIIPCELFLARLKLAWGDVAGAAAMLAETERSVRQNDFVQRMPEVAAAHVLTLLRQGNVAAAAHLVQTHDLPISQARVFLAQGDAAKALALLSPLRRQMEAKGWQDERLRVMVLEAIALYAHSEKDKAVQLLDEALALAEPGGFIRLFVDEGPPMAQLLTEVAARGTMPDYTAKLLAACAADEPQPAAGAVRPASFAAQPLIEPLSQRELEVLQLLAKGLSNREIGERLFLALDTVKGHNRRIFAKLQVQGAPKPSPAPASWVCCRSHFPKLPQPSKTTPPTNTKVLRGNEEGKKGSL